MAIIPMAGVALAISLTPTVLAPVTEAASAAPSTATIASVVAAPAQTGDVVAQRGDEGSTVRDLQTKLAGAKFPPGPIDGDYGRRTAAAVSAFQNAVGLPVTGIYDQATADTLASYSPPADSSTEEPEPVPTMSVRQAQQRLVDIGFNPGPVDGKYGRKTRSGLEAFQRHVGIPVTGDIDAATARALNDFTGTAETQPDAPADTQSDTPADSRATGLAGVQRQLAAGPFDPGAADGNYGTKTKNAIWALEKLAGLPMNGTWSDADQSALDQVMNGTIGGPKQSYGRRWVEVDLSQQLLMVYDPGRTEPVLVSHVSSGNGIPWRQGRYSGRSITPVGEFTIFRRISGWRQSSLGIGSLYNPLYFTNSGIAFHGSRSVPSYPASHGCVRVPMHIAEYLPQLLPNGTPVSVRQ